MAREGAGVEGDPNLAFEHWDEYWRKIHGPKFAQPATVEFVRHYTQLHTINLIQKDPEGSKIDAVSVLAFASLNDVEDYLLSDDHAAIEASENALAGEGSEWWTAINYSIINRLLPEVVTTL